MQAALALSSPPLASLFHHSSSRPSPHHQFSASPLQHAPAKLRPTLICFAQEEDDLEPYFVYDVKKSVFPAEACEELGGDSCAAEGVGPEVKYKTVITKVRKSKTGEEEREYVEYTETKTVFPGDACEELGGEFCEPDYQMGVFPERASVKRE